MELKELQTNLRGKLDAVNAIFDKAGNEELPREKREEVKRLNAEIEEIELEIGETKELDGIRAKNVTRANDLKNGVNRLDAANGGNGGNREFKTVGEQFVNDPGFLDWHKKLMPHGPNNPLPEKMRIGDGPAVEVKALVTGASATSAGALVRRDYAATVELPYRPLNLLDLVTRGKTGSDLIEYARFVSRTNNSAPVAEATTVSNGLKPESAMTLEKVTTAVKTLAHWIPVTKRALADAAQIETYINEFLDTGLQETIENQILNGDGSGENFQGITTLSGTTAQALATDMLTTSRKARTKARITGRANASAFLLNPYDWEALDLTKDSQGRYYWGGPSELGNPRLWGLPVVENELVTQGTFFVGDFKTIVIWDREQASIRMSDSHSDFFVRNLVAILAELRAAMGVMRPAAIVKGSFLV